jgi:hypothetical protein
VRVLIDEQFDHRLRLLLGSHEIYTVAYRGWTGLKNGTLLRTAEEGGIEVFVTGDQTLRSEVNLKKRRLAIVVLSAIELAILSEHLPEIRAAIDRAFPGSFEEVDCGHFER